MKKQSFKFKETGYFGELFLDFIAENEQLNPFYTSLETIDLQSFNIDLDKRDTLVSVIEEQAKVTQLSSKSTYNLNLLKDENTLTVTTGHQLNLMGGPLFFTYKIVSTIRACEEYAKQFPNYNFVPIYWMATEDHDFAEINHFYLFGKKHTWEKSAENQAVGSLDLEGIQAVLEANSDIPEEIKDCYSSSQTLKEAHAKLVYHLFGKYGILVLDANDTRLKASLVDFAMKEIEQEVVHAEVSKTNAALESLGYKTQVNPRNCNLFYLKNGKRYRVDTEGEKVVLVGSEKTFSKTEFISAIKENPSLISPNVLIRPLYQQLILPNIAYIGGPGELAYWLQLKGMFESQNLTFPLLIPRFFALYLTEFLQKKMEKADFSVEQLFVPFEKLKQEVLDKDTEGSELLQSIETQFENYKTGLLDSLKDQINLSLVSFTESALTRMSKENENIYKRIKKEIEARNSIKIERIKAILDAVFPEGSLQERRESVFTFLINEPDFIENAYHAINPFDYQFNVLTND